MDEQPRRWGKAGVRLSEEQRRASNLRGLARRRDHDLAVARNLHVAKTMWRYGMVVPHRITMALDMLDLFGPEVDAACNAAEPDVDLWEAGKKYPRWDQLELLAELTSKQPRWFCEAGTPISLWQTSMVHHVSQAQLREWRQPVVRYPDHVVAACPGTEFFTGVGG